QPLPPKLPSSPSRVATGEGWGEGTPTSGLPALELVKAIGIPVLESVLVLGPNQAAAEAERLGFPVVLKLGDPPVLHKTESQGVVLGLDSPRAVREAALRLGGPLLVQRQVSGGLEMILGLQTDPRLGTFVLCGLGGIWAEALDDVAIRPVGLRQGEAHDMLDQLRARKWLDGLRGSPALDVEALAQAVERLAAFGEAHGSAIASLDINPAIVLPQGVIAVDALVVPFKANA
ncbi:MAG: acetate--CoA ligase family protein, partial [Chloroflexota bacterium]